MAQSQSPVQPAVELSLDDIIAELDAPFSGKLPEAALRAAQRRREEITPRLIDLIRTATATVRAGDNVTGEGHLFALYLLTEFRAAEALPAILEAVSLPGEGSYDVFGDSVCEDLGCVLAALAENAADVCDRLIADVSISEYVRWTAAGTYLQLVRDGVITRDRAVSRLRDHLRRAIDNHDTDGISGLVTELVSYSPTEALGEIEEAFEKDLVDCSIVDMDCVRTSLADGQAEFLHSLEECRPTGVEDTVERLRGWWCFQEHATFPDKIYVPPVRRADDWPNEFDEEPNDFDDSDVPVVAGTIQYAEARVGRNEPCPCGSGKKFKKCCGKNA